MSEKYVQVDRTDAVATVTLNLTERRNALTLASKMALRDAVADVAREDGVRAVVLASAGMAFCVGQDLAEHAEGLADGVGLTFDSGLSITLPRSVGEARAKELILFGRTFTADEAIGWGIAGETVEAGEVLARAVALAQHLGQGPTAAFAASKQLVLSSSGLALDDALEAEAVAQTT